MLNVESLLKKSIAVSTVFALFATSTSPAWAAGFPVTGHTRPFVASSADLGPVASTYKLKIRLWLQPQNSSTVDKTLAEQMNPNSANYHQWLSTHQDVQQLKASQSNAEQVSHYLQRKGADAVQMDAHGTYVSAIITAAQAQDIFHVQLHTFNLNGKKVIANTSDPKLDDEISAQVIYVGGLTTHKKSPYFSRQRDLDTGAVINAQPFPSNGKTGAYEVNCFREPVTYNFTTPTAPQSGASPLPLPSASPSSLPSPSLSPIQATYTGNRYGADADAPAPKLPPCGYSPATIQKVYGISDLIGAGLDGSGQTIVIIDAFGSPTIETDIQAFSKASNLPAAELTVYAPSGPTVSGPWNALQQDWAGETTLDVEWAHVIAPGAKIALVEAASPNDDDLAAAFAFALDNHLGNIVSNSWGGPESQEAPASIALWDILLKSAASQGVAVNFSSGDTGDFVSDGKGGGLGYLDVSYPTSSAYVTGVGGTSLALNSDLSIKFQVGWGTSGSRITDGVAKASQSAAFQNAPLDTPVKLGFIGGSGGGTSRLVAKPDFQKNLPGANRMVPDIAFLADPYTGVELIESAFDSKGNPEPGTLAISVIGGTSLASPMFSALWAVADQAHGSSLGQAAPLLYGLSPSALAEAVTDIVPMGSATNVTGTITDGNGVNLLNALSLGLPQTMAPFFSAIYNSPNSPYRWDVISFGADSSLETAVGWDNVTGLGVPNGVQFIKQLGQVGAGR